MDRHSKSCLIGDEESTVGPSLWCGTTSCKGWAYLGPAKGKLGGSRRKWVVPAVVFRCALQAISRSAGRRLAKTAELNLQAPLSP